MAKEKLTLADKLISVKELIVGWAMYHQTLDLDEIIDIIGKTIEKIEKKEAVKTAKRIGRKK